MLLKKVEHLIITLPGEAVLAGGLSGAESFAFAFHKHEQARRDLIVQGDDQFARGTDDAAVGEHESHGPGLGVGGGAGEDLEIRIGERGRLVK